MAKEPEIRACEHCGSTFVAKRKGTRFCSSQCRGWAYYAANRKAINERQRAEWREFRAYKVLRDGMAAAQVLLNPNTENRSQDREGE